MNNENEHVVVQEAPSTTFAALVTSDLTLSAHCLAVLQQRRHCCTSLSDRFVTLRSKHAATCHPSDLLHQAKLRVRLISNQVQSDVLVCSPGLQVSEATKSS